MPWGRKKRLVYVTDGKQVNPGKPKHVMMRCYKRPQQQSVTSATTSIEQEQRCDKTHCYNKREKGVKDNSLTIKRVPVDWNLARGRLIMWITQKCSPQYQYGTAPMRSARERPGIQYNALSWLDDVATCAHLPNVCFTNHGNRWKCPGLDQAGLTKSSSTNVFTS